MPIQTNEKTCRLGRRPVNQGLRYQLSNRGLVDKSATERKLKPCAHMLTVGTWNVPTMWAPGKLELLENEMKRYRFYILGLAEIRWTASGVMRGCKVIWSRNEQKYEAGVGFLLSKRAREALLGYKPANDKVMVARFQARPFNMSVVQIYAPTSDSTSEQVKQFYADLKTTLDDIRKNRNHCR